MEQESRVENEETASRQPPEGPVLCVNNCGFFGNATTMNLCSQCYRNVVMKQAKAAESIASTSSKQNISEEPQPTQPVLVTEVEIKSGNELLSSSTPSVPPTPNRCFTCNKRVGLTGFKCKCGNQFCGLHRYTDKHNCSFDYRAAGREAISKANPIIKAEKIDKIWKLYFDPWHLWYLAYVCCFISCGSVLFCQSILDFIISIP